MRLPVILLGLALLAASVGAQAQAVHDDPENTLVMQLNDGLVMIELRPDLAPNHVTRIKELVRKGFYDGTPFHRVVPGTIAQTGDPTGTGEGGSGQTLKAEFSNEHHLRGTVSMARADAIDSADSQFFIVMKPSPGFDRHYTIWGHVIVGMEFVNHIKSGDPESGRVANAPDRIVSMKVLADAQKADGSK